MTRFGLLFLCLSAGLSAQTSPPGGASFRINYAYRYRLLGVFDARTGEPVAGAEIADVLGGNKSLTTPSGTVSLLFLPEGVSFVRVRKLGYEVQTVPVSISPADTTPITIVLNPATQLPTVVVTDSARTKPISPALRRFEERRSGGIGQFIPESELRKNDDQPLSNFLLGRLHGVIAEPGDPQIMGPGAVVLVASRKACAGRVLTGCPTTTPACFVTVYVDGVRIYDPETSPPQLRPDFSKLHPRDYAAVEFYAGGASLPAEFSAMGSDCGALLLWSRER